MFTFGGKQYQATTGRKPNIDYANLIGAQAANLPALYQAKEAKKQSADQLALEREKLNKSIELSEKELEAFQKQSETELGQNKELAEKAMALERQIADQKEQAAALLAQEQLASQEKSALQSNLASGASTAISAYQLYDKIFGAKTPATTTTTAPAAAEQETTTGSTLGLTGAGSTGMAGSSLAQGGSFIPSGVDLIGSATAPALEFAMPATQAGSFIPAGTDIIGSSAVPALEWSAVPAADYSLVGMGAGGVGAGTLGTGASTAAPLGALTAAEAAGYGGVSGAATSGAGGATVGGLAGAGYGALAALPYIFGAVMSGKHKKEGEEEKARIWEEWKRDYTPLFEAQLNQLSTLKTPEEREAWYIDRLTGPGKTIDESRLATPGTTDPNKYLAHPSLIIEQAAKAGIISPEEEKRLTTIETYPRVQENWNLAGTGETSPTTVASSSLYGMPNQDTAYASNVWNTINPNVYAGLTLVDEMDALKKQGLEDIEGTAKKKYVVDPTKTAKPNYGLEGLNW